jgi:hypothetical protein
MADFSLNNLANNEIFDFSKIIYNSESTNDFISQESPYDDINLQCTYTNETDFISANSNCTTPYVMSVNIQSLVSKFTDFSSLIYELAKNNCAPIIICIQEIWQIPCDDFISLKGYQPLIYKCRNNNTQGGGVGIYVRNNVSYSLNKPLSVFVDRIFESIFIDVVISGKKFTVGSLYRPGNHPTLTQNEQFNEFTDIFSHTLDNLSNCKPPLLLYGDINIDCLRYSHSSISTEYIDLLFSYGMLQLVTRPTRCTVTSASLIDHIIVNSHSLTTKVFILVSMLSDHFPLIHFMTATEPKSLKSKIVGRDYSEINISNFNNALSALSWNEILTEADPQIALNKFYDTFQTLFDLYVPLSSKTFNRNYHKMVY